MNCLEKRLASHKSNMQHISYLNSFMDEMDQEVMSLTDRAFKSLCIGDEAVYNDSGFSPSPADCHKPLAEEIPKNTQDKSSMDVKKHTAQLLSDLNNTPWQTNTNSPKVSSLFDKTKMANGDSWEKSALSIQRPLSQFSSDHQNHLVDKHFSEVKDNLKSSEKRTVSTSSKKTPTQPGKSTKNKNSKFSKLRNLNSNNFFLHSDSSPFQCWDALNRLGFEDIKILPNKKPDDLYDSPPSTKVTTSDTLHFSQSSKEETAPESQNKPKANVLNQSAQALKIVPLDSERHTELNSKRSEMCPPQPEVLHTSSGLVQRCQSDGELCAPWRKNRSRVKGLIQTLVSSPVCEMSGTGVVDAVQIKSKVGTMEEGTSSSSTPFSISQLLSPTVPSRQGTGFPGILQAALSPAGIDQPILLETEMHSSPEIRREGYKSMASSLLFNLKDNRKRIKTMYSPSKPKGLDCADLHKPFPPTKQDVTKMTLDISQMSDVRSLEHQKVHRSHVSPADVQCSPVSVHINISLPDDFLALSLLQDKNRDSPVKHLKAKKNPVAKATYPSLKLYRKTSPVEFGTKTSPGDEPGSHSTVYKGTKHENDDKELQRENNLVKPVANNTKLEDTHMNYAKTSRKTDEILTDDMDAAVPAEKYPPTELLEHNARQDILERSGSSSQDNLKTGEKRKVEKRQVKDKECQGKEPNHKHLFSAKQNNYIKSQRYANVDDGECGREKVVYSGKDVSRKREPDIGETMQNLVDETFISEHVTHDAFTIKNVTCSKNDMVTACHEQKVAKNNALSMKGNTLAKISLFTLKEQELTKTLPISKKDNIVIDNYKPATVTLEKDIAEREQREVLLSTDSDDVRSCKSQQCGQDFAMEGDHKQVSMLASNQKDISGSVSAERKGQKVISDFKPPSQNFQTMPDTDTKHGERHVAEVKLAEPKQEGAAEHSKHATRKITYTEMDGSDRNSQQSDTDNVKAIGKLIEIEEQAKKISFAKESLVPIVPTNADKQLTGQSQDKSAIQKKCHCYNPEFSLIKVRENSQSEGIARNERESKEDVTEKEDRVNDIKLMSTDVHKLKANLLKDRRVVREDVTVLERNFNKEQVGPILDVQGCLFHVDIQTDLQEKEQIKQKETVSKHKVSAPKVETKSNNESTRVLSNKELSDNNSKPVTRDELEIKNLAAERFNIPDNQTVHNDITELVEDKNDKNTKESASDDSGKPNDQQQKSKCLSKSSVIKGFFEKSDTGKIKCGNDSDKEINKQTSPTLDELTPKGALMNSTTYNVLKPDNTSSLVDMQDNTESFTQIKCDLSSQGRQFKGHMEKTTDNYAFTNPENKPYISDIAVSPTSNVDKVGLVQCLRNSASSLTPTYQSNPSSPTMGKPALFKVKDNTFSVSPVTKTVRPILHKTIPEAAQPWSPGGLSGSERCDKDPDIFLASVELKSPIHHTNQSSGQTVSSSTSQFTTDREKKVMNDSYTVSVEEEWQSAVSSVSEEIESCRTSLGDTVEELVSSMAFTESTEGSKAPSETAESVCSGNENQSHGKPPAVPPKTEKALRRAMKLTTKRIQKAEAKGKSERGRSSEKDTSQIRERRHCSSDKLPSNSSYYKEQSTDRGSKQITGENVTENRTRLPKNHTSARQPGHQESHNKEKVANGKSKQRDQSNLANDHHDGNNCVNDKHNKDIGQFNGQNENICGKRLGRTGEKYLPDKMYRRAHSLDRVLNGKHEHLPSTECLMNSEASSKLPNAHSAHLQQNSSEHTNDTTTNKIVPQSFPTTQRKILQDPDSGQYFMVDMPMQVQTKTFFDPETGNYVQLPVQSFEASAPQTQSMEVVNSPPVVLYHGFVPMPVSSVPQQKSTVNVDSVVPSGYQHVFESSDMETHLPKAQKRQTALH